jgi:hypothetical protein
MNTLILVMKKIDCDGDHSGYCDDDCENNRKIIFAADNFKQVNEWVAKLDKSVKDDFVWEIWRGGDHDAFRCGDIRRVETTVYEYKIIDDGLHPAGWEAQGDPSAI